MTDRERDEIEQVIAKWREAPAYHLSETGHRAYQQRCECADELEAVLRRSSAVPPEIGGGSPVASCLICGQRGALAVWYAGTRQGVCERCRRAAQTEPVESRAAVNIAAWKCKHCGCLWRDNLDGTVSLFDAQQQSCRECEESTPHACVIHWIAMAESRAVQFKLDLLRRIQDALVEAFYDPDPVDPTPELDYSLVNWVGVIADARKQIDKLKTSAVLPEPPKQPPIANGRKFSEWWMCWHCFAAYQVPTSGYYGDCQQCGRPTLPCPIDPDGIKTIAWKRRKGDA